ncbi:NACHT, LRR and PYD domains-containing protein 12-like [Trichomycterus rosablanca]|uniref:NACHT, LRR and PYD domains-containing protein 12-like n=1 Tax=Trichomycterus rosablanca TaxID=2290929 RepID=UPI002F356F78
MIRTGFSYAAAAMVLQPEVPHHVLLTTTPSEGEDRPPSPAPSGVSMQSDHSMGHPATFNDGRTSQRSEGEDRPPSPAPSGVSMQSDYSMGHPATFNDGRTSQRSTDHLNQKPANKLQKKITDFISVFDEVEKKILRFVKKELEMFKNLLKEENTNYNEEMKDEKRFSLRDSALNMIFHFLKTMERDDIADALQTNVLIGFQQHKLKLILRKKYHYAWEGISKQGESAILNQIYTDLYITEATQIQQERQLECQNMFEPLPGQDKVIRTVLTQGVAGIGKSICVQKFVLDWATDKKYQDIKLLFPLPFRELNLKKEKRSLMDIIYEFFPETKGLRFTDRYKVMFIFDGLDECRLPLAFQENKTLTNASMPATLDVILTSLIKGDLLPSALIWITTRPAAAARIPAECVERVTEIRGFNDQQKEEYFRKRISDESLANNIIKHIKASRSLFLMCHIPVFCWISASVLEKILKETEDEETPKTLTEMYTYFLIFQTIQGNLKYTGKNSSDIPWDKEAILALGKLAFYNLEKSNLIFYAEDLEECGIDVSKISAYSGLCTQETSRFHDTVFSFVHLSIQEFIASLYAYMRLINENVNVFDQESTSAEIPEEKTMELLRTAVDKALESNSGHLDLFLHFLLGLTVDYNQKLIRGLLKSSGRSSDYQKEIAQYIKMKFDENPSPERSINLFYCLKELNDDTLVKEIQNHLRSGRLSEAELSPAQWSALVFVLLTSEEDLDVFDLQKFIRSDECFRRLLPVVKESKRALLSSCNLTDRSCSDLLTILNSQSKLTEVDLSNNDLQDSGVELISAGLKNQNCKLEILSLRNCSITDKSCTDLKSALDVNPSHLKDLDLSNNHLGDLGVIQISHLLKNPQFKLHKLTLSDCGVGEEGYVALAEALRSNPSSELMELDLRGNHPGDSGVKPLYELLDNPESKLNTLRLLGAAAEEAFNDLKKVVSINLLVERELDLSQKIHGDSGVKKLSELLNDPHCRPTTLRLCGCSLTENDCTTLVSALSINPSHLTDLDLSKNPIGNSGVKELVPLLQNPHCKLQKLQINDDDLTMESCSALSEVLRSGSSGLRELDLSNNNLQNSGVKKLCEGLKKKECKLEVLRLSDCGVGEKGFAALAEALRSNRSYMKELDLRGNHPGQSGVQKICTVCKAGWLNWTNEIKLRFDKPVGSTHPGQGQNKPEDQQTPEPGSFSSSQKPAKYKETQNTDQGESFSSTSDSKNKLYTEPRQFNKTLADIKLQVIFTAPCSEALDQSSVLLLVVPGDTSNNGGVIGELLEVAGSRVSIRGVYHEEEWW